MHGTAFAEAHHWRPEPAREAQDTAEPDVDLVAAALQLLRAIAEDALVRPSHRVAARRWLRQLQAAAE